MFSLRASSAGTRRRKGEAVVFAVITLLALTGCSPAHDDSGGATGTSAASHAEEGAFPVVVEHALGETTIDTEPQRIAVIGWTTPDIVVALGRVPIAVGKNTYGADDAGHFAWFSDAVEELGGELPAALPSLERGEIDFEELLETAPDLILATYSGITEEDYVRLSEIAPTVAYPETAWATPLDENIAIVGEALGVPDRAGELQASLDATISAVAQEHPEFEGVTFAYGTVPSDDGTLLLNGPTDTRVQLLEQLGLVLEPGVSVLAEASQESSSFNVSLEEVSELSPQLFVTNVEDEAEWESALSGSSIFANWAPIAGDNAVVTTDHAQTMSLASPSPLSVPWGLEAFVGPLSEAIAHLE